MGFHMAWNYTQSGVFSGIVSGGDTDPGLFKSRIEGPVALTGGAFGLESSLIAFLLRNFPQLTEAQVGKLLGTTKETIQKVRDRTHWNSVNIKPRDPVILGLCSQTDLNAAVSAANERLEREGKAMPEAPPPSSDSDEAN